jgi:hypothetical protein
MSQHASIKVDLAGLEAIGQLVRGKIAIEYAGVFFPEEDWNDFPIVVLGWWLEEIKKLSRCGPGTTGRVRFMDGPFECALSFTGPDTLNLSFVDEGSRPAQMVGSAETSLGAFLAESIRVASELLKVCEHKGWKSRDIDRLRELRDEFGSG